MLNSIKFLFQLLLLFFQPGFFGIQLADTQGIHPSFDGRPFSPEAFDLPLCVFEGNSGVQFYGVVVSDA